MATENEIIKKACGGGYSINNIYNEDCITAMQSMPDKCIDMVLTDPPYNINFSSQRRKEKFEVIENDNLSDDDFDALLTTYFKECYRLLKDDTFLISFMGWSTIPFFEKAIKQAGFEIKSMPIWVKNNFGLGYYTRPQYEPMYLCLKGKPKPPQVAISDILNYAKVNDLVHSCEKPVPLLQKLLKTFSNEGDIVFDGFAGSGSTCIAARKLNRYYLGFEIDKKYYDIATDRIKKEFSQLSLFWS